MENFRFILENPYPNAGNIKQRKRARLVTACDSCRVKKIKCQQTSPNGRCEACKVAKTPCLFGDRDRYQAERGVSCAWSTSMQDIQPALPLHSSSDNSNISKSAYFPYPNSQPSRQSLPSSSTTRPGSPSFFPQTYSSPSNSFHPGVLPKHGLQTFPHHSQIPNSSLNNHTFLDGVSDNMPLFDPRQPRSPHPQRLPHLAVLFFDSIGRSFPFLDRLDVLHRIEQKTCSAILANCIASLALRYSNNPDNRPAASAFYDMAKNLAVKVGSTPSIEALHALICITWSEYSFGQMDNFWAFSRMAITMCLELGLGYEATIRVATTPEVRIRLRLTWWTVVCVADIAASWTTGRPTTIDLSKYDTQFPQKNDDTIIMFRTMTQLYLLRSKIGQIVDSYVGNRLESSLEWSLSELQVELEQIVKSLPPSLIFTLENSARAYQCGFSTIFIQTHLLVHAVIILINQPALLTPYNLLMSTNDIRIEAARASVKSFVEIFLINEEFIPMGPLQDPFIDIPLLVAIQFLTIEIQTIPMTSNGTKPWQTVSLNVCKDALLSVSSYCGNNSPFETLLQQKSGFFFPNTTPDLFTVSNSNMDWLHRPALPDDSSSDTSSSFHSSSREISPFIVHDSISSHEPPFLRTISPLVQSVERETASTLSTGLNYNFSTLAGGPGTSDRLQYHSYADSRRLLSADSRPGLVIPLDYRTSNLPKSLGDQFLLPWPLTS